MKTHHRIFWSLMVSLFTFSMATTVAAQGTTSKNGEALASGATNSASKSESGLRASLANVRVERQWISTAQQRTRSADYAMGYNLVAEDTATDQVAAGFNIAVGSVEGAQIAGGFNVIDESLRGAQMAPVFNVTGGDLSGLQFAGAFNSGGGTLTGLQLAGGLNSNQGPVRGVQLAPLNIATGPVQGAQIGVLNIAPSAEVGIGLFNIYWNGELEAELYGSDDNLMMLGIRHGGKRVYNVYHLGTRETGEPQMPFAYGMGLGVRLGLGDHAEISIDATGTSILGGTRNWSWKDQVNLFKLRPMLSLQVAETLAFFGGPTATLMVNARSADAEDYSRFQPRQLATVDEDGADVAIWPGFTFGVRLF